MHASQDVRVLRCLDGLHYSFAMLEEVNAELHASCSKITGNPKALVGALWRGRSFIDLVHRIREIALAMPGLNKKAPELLDFLGATKRAAPFRNYIQHLSNELANPATQTQPVWGGLSWVPSDDPTSCQTAIFGTQSAGVGFTSCVFDMHERRWVSRVALSTAKGVFNSTRSLPPA